MDALRGVAALVVALHHAAGNYMPGSRMRLTEWFDPGTFGVLVFFLVSGYIIPASLERRGDLRRFWISRAFRIYPLLLAVLAAGVVLVAAGGNRLNGAGGDQPAVITFLAHATMLQDMLAVPNGVYVIWTLSYEMAFYLLVAGLFAAGLHRRSAGVAVALTALAVLLVTVAWGAEVSVRAGVNRTVVGAAAVMAVAVGLACTRRPVLARAGAILGAVLAVALTVLNSRAATWEGLIILAVMFTGTALYRAEHGQLQWRTALGAAGAVLAAAVGLGLYANRSWGPGVTDWGAKRAWASAVVLAALLFAAGMALRHRPMPRWLTWLGVVSYSVYLLHPVLLAALTTFYKPAEERPLMVLAFPLLLLPAAYLTYRAVERPMQNLGHRVARRLT
ncbi:acyltransferase [Actinomadura sp. PM05-2]|uniref:Acyltransferase n=1 Tax=Actinomadura parmotrematis TaxID=2864039 RepID=A0ABS7FS51_9ACTN|nr:acyltransferase [Actinomadura parmotrematis]